MKTIQINLILLLFCSSLLGQTVIPGSITSNLTLTKAGNPHKLQSKVVVFQNATLTISPGVVILCDTLSSIEVRGVLTAIGSPVDNIIFKTSGQDSTVHIWGGIKVIGVDQKPKNQITMKYVKFSNTRGGVNLDFAYDGPYVFENCTFSNNNVVFGHSGSPETRISESIFSNNNICLMHCQFSCVVDQSKFIDNVWGVDGWAKTTNCYFTGNKRAMRPYGIATNNVIENNVLGAEVGQNAVNKIFTNNVIVNNQRGVDASGFVNFQGTEFKGNKICNNTDYDLNYTSVRNGNFMNNCWCSTDSSVIRSNIKDGHQNNQYGLATFMPYKTSCNGATSVESKETFSKNVRVVNPFSSNLVIGLENQSQFNLLLFDQLGQLVLSETIDQGKSDIQTSYLKEGLYLYVVQDVFGEIYRGKILKQD